MPTPPRPKLNRPVTIALPAQLRTDLEKLADKQFSPLAHIVRMACLTYVELEREKQRAK